jgi:hypothetical protein
MHRSSVTPGASGTPSTNIAVPASLSVNSTTTGSGSASRFGSGSGSGVRSGATGGVGSAAVGIGADGRRVGPRSSVGVAVVPIGT